MRLNKRRRKERKKELRQLASGIPYLRACYVFHFYSDEASRQKHSCLPLSCWWHRCNQFAHDCGSELWCWYTRSSMQSIPRNRRGARRCRADQSLPQQIGWRCSCNSACKCGRETWTPTNAFSKGRRGRIEIIQVSLHVCQLTKKKTV